MTAISATTAQFGCGGGTSAAAINCAIAAGATISSFATNGLDSQGDLGGTCATGCAFGGLNPTAPAMPFLVPAGISKYNALDVKLNYQKNNPFKGMHAVNAQVSYSYSSFKNSGGGSGISGTLGGISNSDQDFIVPSLDNANPNKYFGPSLAESAEPVFVWRGRKSPVEFPAVVYRSLLFRVVGAYRGARKRSRCYLPD